jgi:glycosyltransferase involved in cell wall biosynthesis
VSADRPIVLTACDYYLPGYRGGGPIRTLAGIVDHLGDELLFKVITRNRDLGEGTPYRDVPVNVWQALGPSQVLYLPSDRLSFRAMRRLISSTRHDVLYLNSFFSVPFTIIPLLLRRLGLIPRRPVIVAPRGELAAGALALKSGRKRAYTALFKRLLVTRDVVWQASGPNEEQDIKRSLGDRQRVSVASDLAVVTETSITDRVEKLPGRLRLLFVSRISPMKNLDGALAMLRDMSGDVVLSIYGPLEDREYWSRCVALMAELPPNIKAHYGGVARPDQVGGLMSENDLLLLPTLGENFGHVILEALASGCPVLISDRTRWRGLEEAGVGWDVPLDRSERFGEILRYCLAADAVTWRGLSERARNYGMASLRDPQAVAQNRALFRLAGAGNPDSG